MAGEEKDLGTGRTGGREATTGVIPGRVALSVGCPDLEPPKGWKWTMLSSVAQLESGHTPSRKHPEYWDEGIPWIGIKDATENHGRTLSDTYQHVSALGLENSSARLLPANTVCLSRTASVGFVVVMGRPMATSQDFVNWVCGPNIEAHYLKYVLLAENEALWRFASGTTHQTIYYPEAKAFHVCLPPLAEQKAIAAVLGALDDKIELNRRMNATLEAMARALFQSWFVDFDPVRAKLDGRPPAALDRVTAALFPDSFQDSEVGRIPTGWTVRSLGEIIDLGSGVPYEAKFKGDSGLPMITLGCVSFHDRFQDKGLTYYSGGYKESHVVKTDDLVVASHDVTQERKQLGSPAMVPRWLKGSTILAATNLYMVRNNSKFPNQYLYQLFRAEGFRQQMVASAKGTVILFISKDSILRHQLAWPSDELAAHFSTEAEALYSQYSINTAQSRTLATLRDTLLPKLLSGELSVAAATDKESLSVQTERRQKP